MDAATAGSYGLAFLDANGDGHVTIRDLWDSFLQLVFLPGDALISLLTIYLPSAAGFLELGPEDHGTVVAKFIAAGVWIAVFIAFGTVVSAIRDFDRALTARLVAHWRECQRLMRMLRTRVRVAFSRRRRTGENDGIEASAITLGALETAVLRCYAGREETRTLAPSDIARALRLSQKQTNAAVRRLLDLRFVERGDPIGTTERHQISQAGQIYLINL